MKTKRKNSKKKLDITKIGKVCTQDGKPLVEKEVSVEVPCHYSNKSTLMMHVEIATGEFDDKKFRLIADFGGRAIRLEYDNHHIDVSSNDMCKALLKKMKELETK